MRVRIPRSAGRAGRAGLVGSVVGAMLLGLAACGTPSVPSSTGTPVRPSEPTTSSSGPGEPTPEPTPSSTPSPTPEPSKTPTQPQTYTQKQPGWALDRIDQRVLPLTSTFTTTTRGAGVTVYVVDGSFDAGDPEFEGRASVGRKGSPCVLEDGINHGLFVAGLVGGRRTGVARRAKIVSVGTTFGCEGGDVSNEDAEASVVKALKWVANHAHRPAVVNLSLNVIKPAPQVRSAVAALIAKDLTVVASAGNAGDDACAFPPAGLPSVITVAGSTKSDRDAGLNHGECVDLYAPAVGVRSVVSTDLVPAGVVVSDQPATSWAAPLVSGGAALYLSAHPDAGPDEVKQALVDRASPGVLGGDLHGSPNRLLYVGGSW